MTPQKKLDLVLDAARSAPANVTDLPPEARHQRIHELTLARLRDLPSEERAELRAELDRLDGI